MADMKSTQKSTFVTVVIGMAVTAGVLFLTVELVSKAWKAGQK